MGTNGYRRPDGTVQRHAIAFLGDVIAADGKKVTEVFIADLPDDLTQAGAGPLAGTATRMPYPPAGVKIRRLTRTADRTSPDGARLACLMKDDVGVVQLWTVSPTGGALMQLTHNTRDIGSAFTWSANGQSIAHVMDGSVCVTDARSGKTRRLTAPPADPADAPSPLACVFSPDGSKIAFMRCVRHADGERYNQVFVVAAD